MTRSNFKNRQWVLAKRPDGMVGEENFSWKDEVEIEEIKDGEFLVKNLYLSFDPAQRGWMEDRKSYVPPVQIGEVMRAGSVAQVIESKNSDFKEGDIVEGTFGWQDYAITDGTGLLRASKVPSDIPITTPLSVFGITGMTAYFGLLEIGKPISGDIALISGAAGSTGSIAGQIAKIKGCEVIGIAGGAEKCRWLTEEANFDSAIDYKEANMRQSIREVCPKGVNVVFDNVGGDFLDAALTQLSLNSRIVLCGAISRYNEKTLPPGPTNYMSLIFMRAKMEGFIVTDYVEKFPEAIEEMKNWVDEGKIIYEEDIQEELENAPKTLQRLYTGMNKGKQLLKLGDPE
ncbi:MAG: NADP-dependent oxidoreductase [SAR86 cluster bacterium]|jgi:NADPH-dependent curcumin reductase|nr:NADP-dependent oxidoreductase [SAR86 cluster bacterium]|tara:strand:- start:9755 stop:10786 length:1032 start_codon:yes stop_codon:yes gene_type:complete